MNILITGSNRGIGLEAAKQLGSRGNRVFITARSESDRSEALKILNKIGINCRGFLLDLSSTASIDAFLYSFDEDIDVLINNAGVHLKGSPSNIEKAVLMDSFGVNIMGPWYLTSNLIPKLAKSKNPKIINVTSGAGAITSQHHSPIPFSAYRITKLAINEYTRMLSKELPTWKINAVCPGWVRTRMGGKNANSTVEEGADTITWLAEENQETGNFYRFRNIIPW
ncbi:MAG: SDR family NAD(P)-dependent oxidoreductase [Saprospiraceae bacterium]|nr:SDR family NAD(P)-dependent oxidoreductase [Saprospiraceae bacterium]